VDVGVAVGVGVSVAVAVAVGGKTAREAMRFSTCQIHQPQPSSGGKATSRTNAIRINRCESESAPCGFSGGADERPHTRREATLLISSSLPSYVLRSA